MTRTRIDPRSTGFFNFSSYIYIYRERERERELFIKLSLNVAEGKKYVTPSEDRTC